MCAEGAKLVLLVTGLCETGCFYCPISFKKGGTDRIFADEWELTNEQDTKKIIREIEYIDATGAGITGGDPLLVWKRVHTYIMLLKETFGEKFHIHLYTSGLSNAKHIPELVSAGLDEIRFHPALSVWETMDNTPVSHAITTAVDTGVDVALEIPALPGNKQEMVSLINWAASQGIRWVNLNELEFSERNCDAFEAHGYLVKNEVSAAVKGSQETAIDVLNTIACDNFSIGVHYCSVSFKDGIQLTRRIQRRAKHVARQYDVISEDGTLLKGVISGDTNHSLETAMVLLQKTYHVPRKYFFLNVEKKRIEIGLWILEEIAEDLVRHGYHCFLVEEYPTADQLEVERIPLPL